MSDPRPAEHGSGYIVGPVYDHFFFIWSPVWLMALAGGLAVLGVADLELTLGDGEGAKRFYLFPTMALALSMGHVFAVYFRSHLNPKIFRLHPWRFTVVPLAVLAAILSSEVLLVAFAVFITWFDNWHSALQTFGLGRLYDMRAGNDPLAGRRLDIGLALVTFLGPILAGATLAASLYDFERFADVGLVEIARFPGWVLAHQLWLTVPILIGGVGYVVFYVVAYARLARRGYRVSAQKVLLWSALALTSLFMWGFDSFGQSFVVMESFHALQYLALVWWSEEKNLRQVLRLDRAKAGRLVAFVIFVGASLFVGVWAALFSDTRVELAVFLVIEFQHYWYDGFIWSVRKRQV